MVSPLVLYSWVACSGGNECRIAASKTEKLLPGDKLVLVGSQGATEAAMNLLRDGPES